MSSPLFRRLLLALVAFTLLGAFAWPYVTLYRLHRAVEQGDRHALAALVDMEAVRNAMKERLVARADRTLGPGEGPILGWIREGVRQVGGRAVELAVDLEWVEETLRTRSYPSGQAPGLLDDVGYAAFEDWDRFRVRLDSHPGEGERPSSLHLILTLEDGQWRVTDIFEEEAAGRKPGRGS